MSINPNNFSSTRGRLTADPVLFANADGSKGVSFTVAVDDNYVAKDGTRGTRFVDFEGFVRADAKGNSVYGYMAKGREVTVMATPHVNRYTDKSGVEQFKNVNRVEEITLGAKPRAAAAASTAPAVEVAPQTVDPLS